MTSHAEWALATTNGESAKEGNSYTYIYTQKYHLLISKRHTTTSIIILSIFLITIQERILEEENNNLSNWVRTNGLNLFVQ